MKKAYIISTGTELLLGMTVDTNARHISRELASLGIKVVGMSTVGDNRDKIRAAFELGVNSADIIIASGGLGPTKDDLTKEVACEVLGVDLILCNREVDKLKDYFARRDKNMPESNFKQAMFPNNAVILDNSRGTAPGMYLQKDGLVLVLLPGPPREMEKILVEQVKPLLVKEYNLTQNQSVTKIIKVFGPGESQVEEMLADIMENTRGCSIALIAEAGEISINVTSEGQTMKDSKKILAEIVDRIKQKLGRNIFGYDSDNLKTIVFRELAESRSTIAIAESCTGGLMAKYLTDIPGSSTVFWGSVTSYSDEAKVKLLEVPWEIIESYGAVSEETALEMAKGIKKVSKANLGLAITGIAGPDGASGDKPIGLVYIALATDTGTFVKKLKFAGDRTIIRTLAAKSGLDIVRRSIQFGGR
ncbi:MAG TPA: competence/damage-inducible protein A [Syntrophomonadaceae bacterium]|nr:competence/damage-inducible protein A [Syntrophomonadaceae bacterium]